MEDSFSHNFVQQAAGDGGPATYNRWAETYEADTESMHYKAFKSVGAKWKSYICSKWPTKQGTKHKVFDAGCGTGLLGEELLALAPTDSIELYGGDITPNMLKIAESKKIYTELKVANLKEELPYEANYFDSIVCAGVFGKGHCGPECTPNLVRVLKPGGYFFATVKQEIYKNDEVQMNEWHRLIKRCGCELVEDNETDFNYYDFNGSVKAVLMVVYKPQV